MESALWMDEVWSLGLVTRSWPDLLELARLDVNPPLYYLALHGWLKLLAGFGFPASALAARSLNVVVWLALVGVAIALGRRLVGARFAWIPTLLVAGCASVLQFTQDARPYGFAVLGSATCFLLAGLDLDRRRRRASGAWWLWPAYSISAFLALGSHVLCLPLIGLIALAWLALGYRRGLLPAGREWLPPVAAHLFALGAAAPWLLIGFESGRALEAGAPGWLTPATLPNLIRVFTEWMPLGRAGAEVGALSPLMRWLGILCLATLAATPILWRRAVVRDAGSRDDGLGPALLGAGLLVVAAHVLLIWTTQRLGWFHVFYGPRYACLSVGVGAAAIGVGIAAVARRRGTGAALLLAAPWVVAGLAATLIAGRAEAGAGLPGQSARIRAVAGSAPVFFAPERLEPFFHRTLDELGALPSNRLPCALLDADRAVLLQLNAWPQNDPPGEILFRSAVAQGRIRRVASDSLPPATRDFELWTLADRDGDRALLEGWCESGIELPAVAPEGAIATALPQRQLRSQGWSYLEFDRDLIPFRWTASTEATLRFDRALDAGRYRLRLHGYRLPVAGSAAAVRLATPDGEWTRAFEPHAGGFERDLDLTLGTRTADPFELRLGFPTAEVDERTLGVSLRSAAVLPAETR